VTPVSLRYASGPISQSNSPFVSQHLAIIELLDLMNCPNCAKNLWFLRTFCPFCKTSIDAPARPKSVTVVCGAMIAISCVALLASLSRTSLIPSWSRHPVWRSLFYVGLAVIFLSGASALFGHNWARWLLLVGLHTTLELAS
jgi:hypothetical protein